MKNSRNAFERRLDRELRRIAGQVEKVLQAAERADAPHSNELAAAIEELCQRWTEAERERNRIRVSDGEAWIPLRRDAEAAVTGLRTSLGRAISITRGLIGGKRIAAALEGPPAEGALDYRLATSGGTGC